MERPRKSQSSPALIIVLTLLGTITLLHLLTVFEFFHQADTLPTDAALPRPIYAVAHRVLTTQQVGEALRQGANALEIDVTAWKEGWFGDHDGVWENVGDAVEELFRAAAEARETGSNLTFVWLDIKDPNWCDPQDEDWRHCSVAALQEQARQILEPAGVRVLYGFADQNVWGVGYDFVSRHMNKNEALNLDGKGKDLEEYFRTSNVTDVTRRVLSYGASSVTWEFGNCYEEEYYTCTVLRQARESGNFGRVFAWTLHQGEKRSVLDFLFGNAGIDGIIYGPENVPFRDDLDTRAVYQDIREWVDRNSHGRYWATANDSPW
ncbi:phospholipase D [Metarhizium acridum CQMa 102]|uniref:Phospholipase D n=1 Tax=Metarhizium acridum (strain CQMa 102) TaxID=655827 RepID=E9E779_METAQ|nr:phospholipase D [Metarhizium acridum CQMa 102]EFY88254.1 phospholipase D [Metarhizium acridum CQMa 102]